MSGDKFDTQPHGIEGMIVLVRAQAGLQGRLVDFLEGLPVGRIGPWVIGRWGTFVKDPDAAKRLEALIADWSDVTDNAMLKAAATSALKTSKGGR
jgi:hypothetical protein